MCALSNGSVSVLGYYIDLRGWLEVGVGDEAAVEQRLREARTQREAAGGWPATYMNGWCWSGAQFNFRRYLFYGGQVRFEGLDVFEQVLRELLGLGLHLSGFFHAQGEDNQISVAYKVVYDRLNVGEDVPPPVSYVNPPED